MDTKLKNNKKISFLIAAGLVLSAVIIFMSCYGIFEKQAAPYMEKVSTDGVLLRQLQQSNYILYKEVFDRVENKNHSYASLYLKLSEEAVTENENDENVYFTAGELTEELTEALNSLMEEWKRETYEGIGRFMDYCVIHHETGEIIKNTGRNIEALYKGTENPKGQQGEKDSSDQGDHDQDDHDQKEEPYIWLVELSYDGSGNMENIRVRSRNSDELLKNVQSVMSEDLLLEAWNSQVSYYHMKRQGSLIAEPDAGPQYQRKQIHYELVPAISDVTFLYAMTQEQMDVMEGMTSSQEWSLFGNKWMIAAGAYYNTGVCSVYLICLLILGILALILTRWKGYCLHRMNGVKLHLEISVTAVILLLEAVTPVLRMVCYTNGGFYDNLYRQYMTNVSEQAYPVLTGSLNAVMLTFLFGGWYYVITSYGEVFDLGIWQFVRERSLLVMTGEWLYAFLKSRKDHFKEALLHADISQGCSKTLKKILLIQFVILSLITLAWGFGIFLLIPYTLLLYFGIRKYLSDIKGQYEKMLGAAESIAEGNLNTALEEDWGIFDAGREKLGRIQEGFRKAVKEEVKSQKMKTELITNVSHDLKTPLTAITTYIELLGEENLTKEQQKEYLSVLERKSQRLKFLIEDLFEVSKASSGNVTLNPVEVDLFNLMRQVYLELLDKIEEADLLFRFSLPEEKAILLLDSEKTYRIFENLYVNIIKYAMPHTRVYIQAEKSEKEVRIELKNMSAMELNIGPEELTERFVRGDSSRNTEGSGLGLAIANSFVELQGGRMKIEIDGDLFKVSIWWPVN